MEERVEALKIMVQTAHQKKTHFFVVAGDLFDKQSVAKGLVERVVQILAGFEGEHVLVLAGNHDYYEGEGNELWRTFRKASEGTCVLPLLEKSTREFECDGCRIRFYACPCPSKHGNEHVIGWVESEEKTKGVIHVGIAHGNVEGLGMDADQRYFNMSETDFRQSGVHTWLLGHIHAPAPAPETTGRQLYFMPGIHTPDSVKCTHPGHAWWLELGADGSCQHEQMTTGAVRFVRLKPELKSALDIDSLCSECNSLDAPNTVLDLQLSGRLNKEEMLGLNQRLESMASKFLVVNRELNITQVLEDEEIAKRFPEGTLPHALLSDLLKDKDYPGDANMALDIIESF